ncbi:ASCH domain-containing protein [Streptomyces bambusae]|uniref:ASCH domain-containing protein n=1 Tax=Streptomyces bambusae TaxID=1550616 RepID=UPI001D0015AA|nr:ASCH domain-containing protein [Streptomyces bambusae]MCB5169580.1 ASCH domain-containing protein [Streptomyces bambusae]
MRTMELGTEGRLRDRLNALVLSGEKRATTGLLQEYVNETEGLEFVGERLALLDNSGRQQATIEITAVRVLPLDQVPWSHAQAEGEGDPTLEAWRTVHESFWTKIGTPAQPDTPVVCLSFRLLAEEEPGEAA